MEFRPLLLHESNESLSQNHCVQASISLLLSSSLFLLCVLWGGYLSKLHPKGCFYQILSNKEARWRKRQRKKNIKKVRWRKRQRKTSGVNTREKTPALTPVSKTTLLNDYLINTLFVGIMPTSHCASFSTPFWPFCPGGNKQ